MIESLDGCKYSIVNFGGAVEMFRMILCERAFFISNWKKTFFLEDVSFIEQSIVNDVYVWLKVLHSLKMTGGTSEIKKDFVDFFTQNLGSTSNFNLIVTRLSALPIRVSCHTHNISVI